ncbi:MAG: type II secretion system secretin GspD [Hydrocarboniphaga effusa]|nr:type II secretion system secretin GspD [Hydrocarboniphaga effusa]
MKRILSGVVLLAAAAHTWAATTLNMKDADIETLITTVSEVTGKNFIVDEQVKGKVTVISSKPMSAAGVYETFLAVLAVKGFAVVPAGEAFKIVRDANAKTEGGARLSDGSGRPDDDYVTHVYEIQNVSAAQLVPILRQLVPQGGHLAAYTPSNMLIISDRAANVVRLARLIEQIDRTGDREIELVRLQHAGAADIVRIVTALTQQDKQADPTVKPALVIADERSNAVLVGGDKSERQKLLDIISQLDTPLTEDGATQVVYLRYASAENLAPILEGYVAQTDAAGKPGGAATAPQSGGGDGKTRIIADKDTNALVITGSPKSMRAVKNVIAQLDIKRSQVLVEAVVAEVSASKASQLGLDWAVFNPDRIAATGILDAGTLSAVAAAASGNALAAAGAVGNLTGVTAAGGRIRDDGTSFAILLRALRGDGDTNILSTPTLVTMDNEEAEFSAGQEVPFLTGRFSNTGASNVGTTGVVNPFQTIERRDVGLTLGITPQINKGDSVKLKINLEVSSLASGVSNASDLVTNKRTLTNTVNVDSNQILVIGGLIDDNLTEQETAVPYLSRIPLLGALFRSTSVTKVKRNLMVFIRPIILRGTEEMDYYTRRKYDALRNAQLEDGGPVPLVGGTRPLVQNFDDYQELKPVAAPLTEPDTVPLSEQEPPAEEPAQQQ